MRQFELKTIPHPNVDRSIQQELNTLPAEATNEDKKAVATRWHQSTDVDYKELLRTIVAQPTRGQEAMGTEDMEAASDVLVKLNKLGDDEHVLVLENAEYKFLMAKVEATGWKYADPRFAQFVRDLRAAPIVE